MMLRGNGGQDIFFCPEDRYHLFMLMQEGIERFGHRVHAFCLMGNHIHLVIQVSDIPLSRIMQNLSFRYTRWVNSRHKRMGHLFQGRYKALLVDGDSYLRELVRYIHLNPVRAGLVKYLGDYAWSSHQVYLGKERIAWVTCDLVLSYFDNSVDVARKSYAQFVMDGVSETYRAEFHDGCEDSRVLGEDHFLQHVMAQTNEAVAVKISLDEIFMSVASEFGIDEDDLCGPSRKRSFTEARGVAAWLVLEMGQHTLAELARRMNRDPSGLSLLAKKTREKIGRDDVFKKKLERLKLTIQSNNSITQA